MAIYRGTGGSSTTTDETTINAVNQKAAEAATSATNAASSASSAATSASTANTKATQASTSETNAAASASSATQSANAASTSADAALAAQVAAELAETGAVGAESNAILFGNMANTAAADAVEARSFAEAANTSAQTYAAAALSSANDASSYDAAVQANATAAALSETNAAASESAASTAATNAASSATAANASAVSAAASESSVAANATAAAASETNAAASESAAATSESNASGSATAAANSASAASASASGASTSATNAAASETAAATSATSASASADAALAALDSFDDRYLGQKTSDPTLDNDGNALVAGALYFNTTDDVMKVYEGSTWVAAYASLSGALLQNNNLSDVLNVAAARTNLGLGTAATTASTDYVSVTGDSITGNLNFGDNDKAVFGAGSDLQIYADEFNNSHIRDTGTGNLFIRGSSLILEDADGNDYIYCADNGTGGTVTLKHNASNKLATTSTGIDVTGTVTADGLTVDGDGDVNGELTIGSSGTQVRVDSSLTASLVEMNGSTYDYIRSTGASSSLYLQTNGSNTRQRIHSNGDISFYEDTGTTAKFFWDASAESLGIGTSSPSRTLHLENSSGNLLRLNNSATANNSYSLVEFTTGGGANNQIRSYQEDASNSYFSFYTKASGAVAERMRIDSSGNLLVGKTATTEADVGHTLGASGYAYATADGGICYSFNRKTSDGDILRFRKDLTTVGSIGTLAGDLTIGDGDVGIRFDTGTGLVPWNMTTNSATNGTSDLGASTARFKDLYLSGSLSNGSTSATVADIVDVANNPPESFPSGTAMLFQQTSAPTGWTKQTTHNNKALRVVSGTASSGGSSAFTTAFGTPSVSGSVGLSGNLGAGNLSVSMSGNISSTTLSVNTIPSHTHSEQGVGFMSPAGSANSMNGYYGGYGRQIGRNSGAYGNNGAHGHSHNLSGTLTGSPSTGNLSGSLSSATAAINVQYVDIIIATKD